MGPWHGKYRGDKTKQDKERQNMSRHKASVQGKAKTRQTTRSEWRAENGETNDKYVKAQGKAKSRQTTRSGVPRMERQTKT